MSDDEVAPGQYDADHTLLLAFDRTSDDFTDGFELGRMWALLCVWQGTTECEDGGPRWEFVAHERNAEMLLRLAEATGFTVRTERLDDAFVTAIFEAPGGSGC